MSNLETNPDFVSVDTAAESLSVSTKTIRNWIKSGRLPAYETGPKLIRINVLELRAFCKPAQQVNWSPVVNDRSKLMHSARLKLTEGQREATDTSVPASKSDSKSKRGKHDLG